jgi:hypothetical protein
MRLNTFSKRVRRSVMNWADIGRTGLRMIYGRSVKEYLLKENTHFKCTQPAKFDVP